MYIANLELIRKHKNVAGEVVECGTWRGGMIAGMVHVLGKHRGYKLFDSFEGLPEVKEIDGPDAAKWQANKDGDDYFDNCRASELEAERAMNLSGSKNFEINKGWFEKTLANYTSDGGIAVLRLDADWYDSTMECLKILFPLVNKGGVIVIDDYYTWDGCSRAVHDYLSLVKSTCRVASYKNVCYIVKR